MALLKEKINERGIITNYHKIGNASLRNNFLYFELESYPSEEYRHKASPAVVELHDFVITLEEEESMGIRQLCYSKLKTKPEWEDAIDC